MLDSCDTGLKLGLHDVIDSELVGCRVVGPALLGSVVVGSLVGGAGAGIHSHVSIYWPANPNASKSPHGKEIPNSCTSKMASGAPTINTKLIRLDHPTTFPYPQMAQGDVDWPCADATPEHSKGDALYSSHDLIVRQKEQLLSSG